jgi:ABC-type sulfate transport system permease component
VFQRFNSDDTTGAAALAMLLLVISLGVLLAIGALRRWATRHDR